MLSLFSFRGRADRTEWWVTYMVSGLIAQFAAILGMIAYDTDHSLYTLLAVFLWLIALLAIEVTLAVSVKRMRDRGYSPWLVLFGFIPVIGWIWLHIELGFLPAHDHKKTGPRKLVRRQVFAGKDDEAKY
jgi:uncharacterized membrane protein YhaH (DUF805 family)